MRRIRLWLLRAREFSLEAQIETAEDLVLDHQRRMRMLQDELRRVRSGIAISETPQNLLAQALRGRR